MHSETQSDEISWSSSWSEPDEGGDQYPLEPNEACNQGPSCAYRPSSVTSFASSFHSSTSCAPSGLRSSYSLRTHNYMQAKVIRGHQWPFVIISGFQWSSEVIREDAHLAAVARLINLVSRARPRQRPRLALIMGQLALDEHLAQLVGVDTLHAPQSK